MPAFDLQTGVILWLIAFGVIVLAQRALGLQSVGLVVAYFLALGLIHLSGAVLYLDPGYVYLERDWIELGFEQSTYYVIGLSLGAGLALWLLRISRESKPSDQAPARPPAILPWLPRFYLLMGLFSYFIVQPLLSRVPTLGAVLGLLSQFLLVGICLGLWNSWHSKHLRAFAGWVLMLGVLPIMTTLAAGFIGYGTTALMTGLAFLATFFRPRWVIPLAGILFIVVGISVFVTYARDRSQIRRIVWGGESTQERVAQLVETFSEFEWFDPGNPRHLNFIDGRLNQNRLVGANVARIRDGQAEFKFGGTIVEAGIALIPRAIWPDKPVTAGSGDLVTQATGISFAVGTSVGVGQVLEFYFNFGTFGVMVGGFMWGAALALLDVAAGKALHQGDVRYFTLYYLVGLALLQPGGSLVDVTSTVGAAVVAAIVVNEVIAPFFMSALQEAPAPRDNAAEGGPPPPPPRPQPPVIAPEPGHWE